MEFITAQDTDKAFMRCPCPQTNSVKILFFQQAIDPQPLVADGWAGTVKA